MILAAKSLLLTVSGLVRFAKKAAYRRDYGSEIILENCFSRIVVSWNRRLDSRITILENYFETLLLSLCRRFYCSEPVEVEMFRLVNRRSRQFKAIIPARFKNARESWTAILCPCE